MNMMAISRSDMFTDDIERLPITRQSICRRCRKPSTLICMRCEDCYCSKKCQDIDWKSHRYICFPKPPLLEMDSVPNDENIPNLADVEPVHLAEQLRSMVNVCQDFLKRLENKSNCKCNKFENNNSDINDPPENVDHKKALKAPKQLLKQNDNEKNVQNDQTYTGFNAKNVQKSSNFNCNSTLDDASDTVLKQNNKNFNCGSKNKKLQETEFWTATHFVNNSASTKIACTEKSPSDISAMVSSQNIREESGDGIVYLTSFRSANRVAVCPKHLEQDGTLKEIIDQIDKFGRNAAKLTEIPEPGSFVISQRSNKYARAKIVPQKDNNNNAERIRLEFVDFGNLAYRKLSDLREILPALSDLPMHVNIVQLNKVDLINYDDRILRIFSTLENKYYKLKIVTWTAQKTAVELYDLETGDCLNELIMQEFKKNENGDALKMKLIKTKPRNSKDDDNDIKANQKKIKNKENLPKAENHAAQKIVGGPVLNPPFKYNKFSRNARNFKAVILDTSLAGCGYVACIMQSNLGHLHQIQSYLEELTISDEPYCPINHEYVTAKFEDAWYRGKVDCVSADNKKFEITYIDYFNIATLTAKDIRRYPDKLTTDCYTTLCKLSNLPKTLPSAVEEFLKTNIKLYDVIHIDRVVNIAKDDIAMIECHELIDRMHENLSIS